MNNRTPVSRVILYLLLVMAPVLGLLLLGRNFIYDSIVVPIEYELWLAGLAIRALPQPILWGILCALVMVVALTSLLAGKDAPQKVERDEPMRTRSERVAFWTTQIHMASRGSYSKLRFADFFSKLILDILIYTGEVSQEQYENALKTGTMDLPPDILVYLKIRLTPFYELRSLPFFQRLIHSFRALFSPPFESKSAKTEASQDAAFNPELERAVVYLEHELEVNTDQYGD